MNRLAFLAIPLLLAGCAQGPMSGSKGQTSAQASVEVRDAQQQLRALGLYNGLIDGIYGPESQQAVSRFQRDRNLTVTTRLDNATLDALRAEVGRSSTPIVLTDPAQIRSLQMRLRQNNFYEGPVDGIWGPPLQTSLENFQRSRQLAVGQVDRPTLAALEFNPDDFTPRPVAAASAAPTANPGTSLGTASNPGRASDLIGAPKSTPLDPVVVRGVQRRLTDTRFFVEPIDGTWGPATQTALQNFQRSKGLNANGQLDPQTATALGLDPNNLSASAAAVMRNATR